MSDQQQYELIGRMIAEYVEAKRCLAALRSKAISYAATLNAMAGNLGAKRTILICDLSPGSRGSNHSKSIPSGKRLPLSLARLKPR
jgi:hypothetical protein